MPQVITGWFESKDVVPEKVSFGEDYELSGKFALDLWDVDVVSRLSEFEGNVIIIQGSEDQLVSADDSEVASTIFPNARFYLIEGAGHGFKGDDFEKAVSYGLDYLYENT